MTRPDAIGLTANAAAIPFADWVARLPSLPGPALSSLPGSGLLIVLVSAGIGVLVSKFLVRLIGRPVARRVSRQSVAQTIVRGVRVGTITLATLIGLGVAGFQFADLLLGTAVFSAVIGIILAPIVGNFINGIFVLADQPFEIGDMIELENGTTGFVDDITIRYTKIFTLDNTFIVVPNGTMRERDVTNFSAEDERTRRTIDVLVTYESDIPEARRLIERGARDCDAVIDGGPDIRVGVARYTASPDCRLHEFGDDGVLLRLRYWVKKPYKLAKVQSDVNTRIRERLADADVEMAYPHRHLVFDDTSGVARIDGPADAASGDGPTTEEFKADVADEDIAAEDAADAVPADEDDDETAIDDRILDDNDMGTPDTSGSAEHTDTGSERDTGGGQNAVGRRPDDVSADEGDGNSSS
ncbi:mechanosensitive ion channel family protein [Halorubrum laminariae]|uniref:Mechanosensitive ion channel family protein n=1 Tax=Halorubrum laminariae TaxID=1433523 RepID=A0ABD6BWD0_9EURY